MDSRFEVMLSFVFALWFPVAFFFFTARAEFRCLISLGESDISRPEIQEQMNNREEARRQGIALGNYRTQLLQQALQRNIATITAAKCGQWYHFMQTYLPRCLNNEAIEG